MAYYKVNETSLKSIADAIREKDASTDGMIFPDEFCSKIRDFYAEYRSLIDRTITTFTSPVGCTKLGDCSLRNCKSLKEIYLLDGLTAISAYACMGCSDLNNIVFPETLDSIQSYSFANCTSLTSLNFPASLRTINNYGFQNCTGLTEVTFNGILSGSISANAFSGCTNLAIINVPWAEGVVANAPWGATNATVNYNYVANTD
jgi:hypothetical protein